MKACTSELEDLLEHMILLFLESSLGITMKVQGFRNVIGNDRIIKQHDEI